MSAALVPGGPWLRDAASRAGAVRVKLCGLRTPADVAAAVGAGADLVGFVTDVPGARRSVTPERLAALVRRLRELDPLRCVRAVGVFVDEPPAAVAAIAARAGLDAVQLHGGEDERYLAELRALAGPGLGVVQAFVVRGVRDVARARASSADLVLLDGGRGAGAAFDWDLARDVGRPFLLAGGLGPGNVARAVAQARPWGVDMSSGVETDGTKDPAKMRAAVRAARGAVPAGERDGGD